MSKNPFVYSIVTILCLVMILCSRMRVILPLFLLWNQWYLYNLSRARVTCWCHQELVSTSPCRRSVTCRQTCSLVVCLAWCRRPSSIQGFWHWYMFVCLQASPSVSSIGRPVSTRHSISMVSLCVCLSDHMSLCVSRCLAVVVSFIHPGGVTVRN